MREEIDSKFGEQCKHYSVGDMAKMLSLSPSTIRFYDQEGIVVPNRADENTYRKYSVVDGNYLLKAKELKNIGLPIPQIKEIRFCNCPVVRFSSFPSWGMGIWSISNL